LGKIGKCGAEVLEFVQEGENIANIEGGLTQFISPMLLILQVK
jgi:hypothetical protein